MEVDDVPPVLQERLGPDATAGLLALFEIARQEWAAEVTVAAVERFERRLTEESAALRVAMAQGEASIRKDIAELGGTLRNEIGDLRSGLRKEIGDVRSELRKEIGDVRSELLKWSFALWVGQAVATASIVGVMLQLIR